MQSSTVRNGPSNTFQEEPYLTHHIRHHGQVTLIPPENQGRIRKPTPQKKSQGVDGHLQSKKIRKNLSLSSSERMRHCSVDGVEPEHADHRSDSRRIHASSSRSRPSRLFVRQVCTDTESDDSDRYPSIPPPVPSNPPIQPIESDRHLWDNSTPSSSNTVIGVNNASPLRAHADSSSVSETIGSDRQNRSQVKVSRDVRSGELSPAHLLARPPINNGRSRPLPRPPVPTLPPPTEAASQSTDHLGITDILLPPAHDTPISQPSNLLPHSSSSDDVRWSARSSPTIELTDLEVLLSRIYLEGTASYEELLTMGETLGPATVPRPQDPVILPMAMVEIERRRVTKEGKVKVKLSAMGVSIDRCGVCLFQFKAKNMAVLLPCQHCFHDGCVQSWFTHSRTCPLCRAVI